MIGNGIQVSDTWKIVGTNAKIDPRERHQGLVGAFIRQSPQIHRFAVALSFLKTLGLLSNSLLEHSHCIRWYLQ
jgi:hypothetical protein